MAIYRWLEHNRIESWMRENREVVDNSSRTFFDRYRVSILNLMILEVSCLTDHAEQGRNRNLTIETLLQMLPPDFCEEEKRRFWDKLGRVHEITDPLRRHRHKRVAHTDLPIAIGGALPELSRDHIQEALSTLADLMNEIRNRLDMKIDDYWSVHALDGGFDSVAWNLKHGVRRIQERKAQHLPLDDV